MFNDIMDTASNILNTPGVVMMGVGIVSAMVLRSLVSEANNSSPSLISYQTDSDEFPLPIPPSIYNDESRNEQFSRAKKMIPCIGEQLTQNMRNSPPKEWCSFIKNEGKVGKPNAALCVVPMFFENEHAQEILADPEASRQEMAFPSYQRQEHQNETVSSLPKPSNSEELAYSFIPERSSDPAAGDTYLIVEPPEDSSESEKQTSYSKTEAYSHDSVTLSSFTGPFLAPINADDSTSQSVTWTEAFVEREPFDHELERKTDDKKSQKSKLKNQKC